MMGACTRRAIGYLVLRVVTAEFATTHWREERGKWALILTRKLSRFPARPVRATETTINTNTVSLSHLCRMLSYHLGRRQTSLSCLILFRARGNLNEACFSVFFQYFPAISVFSRNFGIFPKFRYFPMGKNREITKSRENTGINL